jgi:hypothetical protein
LTVRSGEALSPLTGSEGHEHAVDALVRALERRDSVSPRERDALRV